MQPKHLFAISLAAAIALGFVGWLVLVPRQATAPSTGNATGDEASTTVVDLGNGEYLHVPAGATVTEQDVPAAAPVPKPPAMPTLAFSADLDADAKQALQTQWNTLTSELKASPTRVDLWLELGVVYKIAGQYDAAIAAWTYVAKSGTNLGYIAQGNLGDLYLNFTHDYAKAAAAYQAALVGQPTNLDYQAGLKAAQSHPESILNQPRSYPQRTVLRTKDGPLCEMMDSC